MFDLLFKRNERDIGRAMNKRYDIPGKAYLHEGGDDETKIQVGFANNFSAQRQSEIVGDAEDKADVI